MTRLAAASLYVAIGLDMVGFGMVIPDIQTRLEAQGANGLIIGAILSCYFLVQMLASPLWGRWSDRVGRKPVLVICGSLSALSLLGYAFANSALTILVSRLLAGVAAANVVAAQAYFIDSVSGNEEEATARRTVLLGRMGAAITAGLILGPTLGGLLSHIGGNFLLGIVAAGASGLGTLAIAVFVPAVPPQRKPEEETPGKRSALSLLRDVPRLRFLLVLTAAALLALACLEGTFGRLIHRRLGYGPFEFGLIFGYEAFIGVLTQTLLLPRLGKRLSVAFLLSAAYLLQAIGLTLTPFAPNLAVLFLLSTFYAAGSGLAGPTVNSLASAETPTERQGEMFGLMQSARSTGFLIGPLLGGVLFDWRVESPYLLAGIVLLGSALAAVLRFRDGTKRDG